MARSEQASIVAKELAAAVGHNVLIGVRPQGTYFASCGDIEYDGSTPLDAVRAVRHRWVEKLRRVASDAAAEARSAECSLAALDASSSS